MSTTNAFIIISLLSSQLIFSQNEKWIHGKIIVKDATPKGVRIVNLGNETETFSDIKGEFDIKAKVDDLLIFPSEHLDYQRKIIEAEDYNKGSITVEMTSKFIQLEEVKIANYSKINALSLGIISKPAKHYTVAERRFHSGMGTWKDVLLERKISSLDYLKELFDDNYYVKELKMAPHLIGGFQYYAIEDNNLTSALNSKNKALISFILLKLSIDYNLLQQPDKIQKDK